MFKRFRRLFLVISALGYGFLGTGPSLWALGLDAPMPASCSATGCTCRHGGKMKAGMKCCCAMQRALAKKFHLDDHAESGCQMRQKPCGPFGADANGYSIPSQQLHTLADAQIQLGTSEVSAPWQPLSSFRSYAPEPPTPVPD